MITEADLFNAEVSFEMVQKIKFIAEKRIKKAKEIKSVLGWK
jgi:hypothetical protein